MLEVIVALTLLFTNAGMNQKEVVCSLELVRIESNYHIDSTNSSSGAYGLFQLMGIDKKLSMKEQVIRFDKYIKHRYKQNSCLALQHLRSKHWY